MDRVTHVVEASALEEEATGGAPFLNIRLVTVVGSGQAGWETLTFPKCPSRASPTLFAIGVVSPERVEGSWQSQPPRERAPEDGADG